MKRCSNCGMPAEDEARFCVNCAQSFQAADTVASSGGMEATMAARACPRCGSTNAATAKYCNECGTSISGADMGDQSGFDSRKVRRIAIIAAAIVALVVAGLVIFLLVKPSYTPSETVKEVVRAAESGNIDRVLDFMPKNMLKEMMTGEIKKKGGVKEINIKDEKIDGDKATVEFEIKMGNGDTEKNTARLVKEDGKWKVNIGPMF